MKARLIHYTTEWLPGDYEAPQPLAAKKQLNVWHVSRDGSTGWVAMKLDKGTGLWDANGKLLLFINVGADLVWSGAPNVLLSLEAKFGPCRNEPKHIAHMLRWREAPSGRVLEETEICVTTGGVNHLVLNHRRNQCLATWLDQNVWGYVLLDLEKRQQLPASLYWRSATLSPPAFSPNDVVAVSCHYFRDGWWTDEIDDFWEYPSPGGLRKVGTISVHDLATNQIANHDVLIDVPPGWLPDNGDRSDWNMIWGPDFISEREFKIWLPDGSTETLALPLPAQIEIRRPLATTRRI